MTLLAIIMFCTFIVAMFLMFNHSWGSKKKHTPTPVRSNWKGIPLPGLKHEEVWQKTKDNIIPYTILAYPKTCPICRDKLTEYKSDWMQFSEYDIEVTGTKNRGQYNVWGLYCKKGHWTYLECA